MPLGADMNTSAAIVFECHVALIVAPYVHHHPDAVFRRMFSANRLSFAPTVHFWAMRPNHIVLWHLKFSTADALDLPAEPFVGGLLFMVVGIRIHEDEVSPRRMSYETQFVLILGMIGAISHDSIFH